MFKPNRPAVPDVFSGADVLGPSQERASRSPSRPPMGIRGLKLRDMFRQHWPQAVNFTIGIDPVYRELATADDITRVFTESLEDLKAIRHICASSDLHDNDTFWQAIENNMVAFIFGSNYIEHAGTTFDITRNLCHAIFRGHNINPEDIDEQSPEYEQGLANLKGRGLVNEDANPRKLVIRSRLEVIQHAKALDHIVSAIVHRNETLTEDLIKDTHKILCYGCDLDDAAWTEYAGKYRDGDVSHAVSGQKRPHKFITHRAVPGFMQQMIAEYQSTIAKIESTGEVDPLTLAARFCYYFVNIHPFWDGNGRLCRLILNAILLKYASILVPIGDDGDKGRDDYLKVCNVSGQEFLSEDFDTASPHGHRRFGAYLIEKTSATLKRFRESLTKT